MPVDRMQQQLRRWAAAEIAAHPERYPRAGPAPIDFAKCMAATGIDANSTTLRAIAQFLDLEVRIWALENAASPDPPADMMYVLYIFKPQPSPRHKKNPH